jgi:hypothetical protein
MSGITHTILAVSLLYAAYRIGQMHLSRFVVNRYLRHQDNNGLSAKQLITILSEEGTYTEKEITDALERWTLRNQNDGE